MYSLHLSCGLENLDDLSFALWEAGTAGIREVENALIAGFDDEVNRDHLSALFASYKPRWIKEEETDWVAFSQECWPARRIGEKLFLAAAWNQEETPHGRIRINHKPGMASGTGEHPCTMLALESLERCVAATRVVVDVGTGSGILMLAALGLGARTAVGIDIDSTSVFAAEENFALNQRRPMLAVGMVDCLGPEIADVVVANISGTVLLSIADDLLRILRSNGQLILTGFPESELAAIQKTFGSGGVVTSMNEWCCLTLRL